MALKKIKVNEIDEKSEPVAGDYALVSDSENDGKLALIPFSGITLQTVNYTYEYTSFTAEPNKKYSVNTLTGDIIVTLPEITEEMISSSISIRHAAGSNSIIVNRSGTNTIAEAGDYTTYSFKGAGSYIDIIAYTESTWVITRSNRVAEPYADSDTNVAATTAWVRDVIVEEVGEAADTLQSRWAYQYHLSGGTITGEPWKIHGFGAAGTINLPKASTVPDGTQIAAMVVSGAATSVDIIQFEGDQFITPVGFASSYTLAGVGSSLVLVKATSNTWAALGTQEALINAAIAPLAPLDSPTFTGTPTAPDASSPTTSSSQIANCKFVQAQKESPALTGTPTAPTAAAGTNTTQLATTAFVQTAADTLQSRWAYQTHSDSGGTITGEQWTIHSFSEPGILLLPRASTVPDGTQIVAMVAADGATVNIASSAYDQFLTPTGFANSYTLAGVGSSLVFVKVQSNTWAALGTKEVLINDAGDQLAPLDSPALTGTPTAPTASVGTNTTQLATTAFVTGALAGKANDADVVKLTGNQSIGGTKTFTTSPVLPTPTAGDNTTKGATTAFVTGAVAGVTASSIGLGSVDNTADTDKPVSTAQAAAIASCSPKHTYVAITTASTAIDAKRGNTYGVNANGCTLTLPSAITAGYVDGDEICVVVGVSAARELAIVSPSYILRGTGLLDVNTPFNVTGLGTFITFTKCSNVWVMH